LALINKKRENFSAYFENLEKSFNLKRDNIATIYELSEHFLFKEDFEKVWILQII